MRERERERLLVSTVLVFRVDEVLRRIRRRRRRGFAMGKSTESPGGAIESSSTESSQHITELQRPSIRHC